MGRHTKESASTTNLGYALLQNGLAHDHPAWVTQIASWLLSTFGFRRSRALLICGFFSSIGTGLVVISLPIYAASVSLARHGRAIDAAVTEITHTPSLRGTASGYDATVEYTVGGRPYQGEIPLNWCSSLGQCQLQVGSQVRVIYDVRNPNHIESEEEARSRWLIPAALVPSGLLVAIPNLVLLIGFGRVREHRDDPELT